MKRENGWIHISMACLLMSGENLKPRDDLVQVVLI